MRYPCISDLHRREPISRARARVLLPPEEEIVRGESFNSELFAGVSRPWNKKGLIILCFFPENFGRASLIPTSLSRLTPPAAPPWVEIAETF